MKAFLNMRFSWVISAALLVTASMANAQTVPSPKQEFGFNIGDVKLHGFR